MTPFAGDPPGWRRVLAVAALILALLFIADRADARTPGWAAEPAFAFEAELAGALEPNDSADIQPRRCGRFRATQLRCRFRVRANGDPWCRQWAVFRPGGWRPGVRGNSCEQLLDRGWRRAGGVWLDD